MSEYQGPKLSPEGQREQAEKHLTLRVAGFCAAILVAVIAFGSIVLGFFKVEDGWQVVSTENQNTGITTQFILNYNAGQAGQSAKEELRAVSQVYSVTLEQSYAALCSIEVADTANLYTLNAHPNEAVTVQPVLYEAFRTLEAEGSRLPYYAPIFNRYFYLYQAASDEDAALYDPEKNPDEMKYVTELAAFAADPAMVQVRLLPDSQLMLEVAPEYLAFAKENDIASFADLGILMNAFLCDAAADALRDHGFVNGYLSSYDGFSRSLCAEELGINIFDLVDGSPVQQKVAAYTGPAAVVSCRSFPITKQEQTSYYTYADGITRAPYLASDGMMRCTASSLASFSETLSAAQLAIRTITAFTAGDTTYPALKDISWVSAQNGTVTSQGTDFTITEPRK